VIHASPPSHDRRRGAKQKTDFAPTPAAALTTGRFLPDAPDGQQGIAPGHDVSFISSQTGIASPAT
jgi:hypothetical protein